MGVDGHLTFAIHAMQFLIRLRSAGNVKNTASLITIPTPKYVTHRHTLRFGQHIKEDRINFCSKGVRSKKLSKSI
jgi:hypothetical protein